MGDDENQQLFSLRWNNHQNLVMDALGGILHSGRWADVTLSAGGRTMKAHRLVLAACSRYFADLFKETEDLGPPLVVVAGCGARELRLLLRLLYTGQATAPRDAVRPLLRLAAALHVTGLTECDTSIPGGSEFEIKYEQENDKRISETQLPQNPTKRRYLNPHNAKYFADNHSLDEEDSSESPRLEVTQNYHRKEPEKVQTDNNNSITTINVDVMQNLWKTNYENRSNTESIRNRLTKATNHNVIDGNIKKKSSKLDKIVENLYCSRNAIQNSKEIGIDLSNTQRIGNSTVPTSTALQSKSPTLFSDIRPRAAQASGAICTVCSKRLSNQYNLRVHMETHAGTRHACSSCTHISRSKDALRKHVAYRHPTVQKNMGKGQLR